MPLQLGYLLPTREKVMAGEPAGKPMLELARQAEDLGYDSIWAGDSLLARPRHEPLTLLSAVAGCTSRVQLGTAVLLPALRNPVVLAHQLATMDQVSEGRVIVGAGIAGDAPPIRAEFAAAGVPFEKRVGRMLELFRLCRALWSGEAVNWNGRWKVTEGVLGPEPYQKGGPPIWVGSFVRAGRERAAKHFDGWFPTGPDAATYGLWLAETREMASAAGRDPMSLTAALYLTIAIDTDAEKADGMINDYLTQYYGVPARVIRERQACFAGSLEAVGDCIQGYIDAGVQHLVCRFVGEHDTMLRQVAELRAARGW